MSGEGKTAKHGEGTNPEDPGRKEAPAAREREGPQVDAEKPKPGASQAPRGRGICTGCKKAWILPVSLCEATCPKRLRLCIFCFSSIRQFAKYKRAVGECCRRTGLEKVENTHAKFVECYDAEAAKTEPPKKKRKEQEAQWKLFKDRALSTPNGVNNQAALEDKIRNKGAPNSSNDNESSASGSDKDPDEDAEGSSSSSSEEDGDGEKKKKKNSRSGKPPSSGGGGDESELLKKRMAEKAEKIVDNLLEGWRDAYSYKNEQPNPSPPAAGAVAASVASAAPDGAPGAAAAPGMHAAAPGAGEEGAGPSDRRSGLGPREGTLVRVGERPAGARNLYAPTDVISHIKNVASRYRELDPYMLNTQRILQVSEQERTGAFVIACQYIALFCESEGRRIGAKLASDSKGKRKAAFSFEVAEKVKSEKINNIVEMNMREKADPGDPKLENLKDPGDPEAPKLAFDFAELLTLETNGSVQQFRDNTISRKADQDLEAGERKKEDRTGAKNLADALRRMRNIGEALRAFPALRQIGPYTTRKHIKRLNDPSRSLGQAALAKRELESPEATAVPPAATAGAGDAAPAARPSAGDAAPAPGPAAEAGDAAPAACPPVGAGDAAPAASPSAGDAAPAAAGPAGKQENGNKRTKARALAEAKALIDAARERLVELRLRGDKRLQGDGESLEFLLDGDLPVLDPESALFTPGPSGSEAALEAALEKAVQVIGQADVRTLARESILAAFKSADVVQQTAREYVGRADLFDELRSAYAYLGDDPAGAGTPRPRLRQKAPDGILLYGPPGTGKTEFASELARRLNFALLEYDHTQTSKYYGESENIVKAFFAFLKHFPDVVFLCDEVDTLFPKAGASGNGDKFHKNISDQCAKGMSALARDLRARRKAGAAGGGPVLIAATNYPLNLEGKFYRRFPKHVYIRPPDAEQRRMFILSFINELEREAIDRYHRELRRLGGTGVPEALGRVFLPECSARENVNKLASDAISGGFTYQVFEEVFTQILPKKKPFDIDYGTLEQAVREGTVKEMHSDSLKQCEAAFKLGAADRRPAADAVTSTQAAAAAPQEAGHINESGEAPAAPPDAAGSSSAKRKAAGAPEGEPGAQRPAVAQAPLARASSSSQAPRPSGADSAV